MMIDRLLVEGDWYDGWRTGVADVGGVPHFFHRINEYALAGVPDDEYLIWPISVRALAWEREQHSIFATWLEGAGTCDGKPHPMGHDPRFDELDVLLAAHRRPPPDARRLRAEWVTRPGGGIIWHPAP